MLALSPTMEKGLILKWNKSEGDQVNQGDVLCEVETDKAAMEYESTESGTLLKILVPEDSSAEVGQTIAIIGEKGEDISSLMEEKPAGEQKKQEPAEEAAQAEPQPEKEEVEKEAQQQPDSDQAQPETQQLRSSPLARKLAAENDIDISEITGTGPDGRITEKDVQKAIEQKPAAQKPAPQQLEEKLTPLTGKQKTIADRMTKSVQTAPHFYLKITAAMDTVLAARENYKQNTELKLSINSFLIKLAAEAISKNPLINSSIDGNNIVQHPTVDIGLSVSQPDAGLITPVVRDCQNKSIPQIDSELKDIVPKARESRLSKDQYTNSTFTISTLGSMGIEEYTAIINPPNSAILSVGKITKQQVLDHNDQPKIQNVLALTLSCDHRVVYGAQGAKFLADLKDIIENPINIFL